MLSQICTLAVSLIQNVYSQIKYFLLIKIYFIVQCLVELETPDNNDGLKHTAQSLLPSARLLIEAFGLIKGQIPASGPKGHLLKGDVLKYIELNKLTRLPLENSHTDQKKASNVQQKATKAAATTTKGILYLNFKHMKIVHFD